MSDVLDLWLYGTHLAQVRRDLSDRLHLDWTEDAAARWGVGTRVLSAILPVGEKVVPAMVRVYLDGLLPEGNARTNYAMDAGVPPDDTFGLIRAYGRDTPGAAVFVESGADDPTSAGTYEPLTRDEVAVRLARADSHSPARYHGLVGESSTLPGMVPKIVLHREGDAWFACKDGAPSTWILKRSFPAESGIADIIDTEAACLDLGRRIGVTTVDAEVLDLAGHRAIAVSRYDRGGGAADGRLHQEDLAQAMGLNTRDPDRKFQYGATIPSLAHAADVLRRDGGNVDDLLRLVTFSHLVGNTDMHAKNISFLRLADGRVRLAPAYDIAMHLHHPRDNRRSALDVRGKSAVAEIEIDDVVAEGVSWGLPERRARSVASELTIDLGVALTEIDRDQHAGVPEEAWDVVTDRVARAGLSVGRGSLVATRRSRGRSMPTSVQLRQRLADLASKRADLERKISEAQRKQSAKQSEAAHKSGSADRASSDGLRRSYGRQADSARQAALGEGRKIADLSKQLATVARDEAARQKELMAAMRSESAAEQRAATTQRQEREKEERRAAEQRRKEERQRHQQRLADEQQLREVRRGHDETRALVAETGHRLSQEIAAIRAPQREQLRILYATASPGGDLRVDEEMRRVKAAVRSSTHRDQVLIEHLPAATAGDVLDGLTTFRPHVVHFSGHADRSSLVFDSGADAPVGGTRVGAHAFKGALEAPDEAPVLVVLNACESGAQLQSMLGRIPMAVGMLSSVADVDAITFATRFYRSLAEGQSVSAALATARADMEMNGLPDHDLPMLEVLPGVDPRDVFLVKPPE